MFVWTGFGFLVAVIGGTALTAVQFLSQYLSGNSRFHLQNSWVNLIGMAVAAAATYGLHRLLSRQKGRVVIDKQTGRECVLRTNHTLFWVPVKWWTIIFLIFGVLLLVAEPAGLLPN